VKYLTLFFPGAVMQKSPAAIVKEKFGDKAKLVAALGPLTEDELWLPRVNKTKGLERVSNAKLLRLHSVLSEVKGKFGTRDKLIAAVCDLEKRTKDEGYKKRLGAYPIPRLYDLYRSLAKRLGAKTEAAPKARAKASASAETKATPAKATSEAKPAARAKAAEAAPAKGEAKKAAPAKKKS
jgi:hypothetical protein